MFKRGQRLMIIELRKYNEIGELLIETEMTGSWGHICYQDGGQRVSVTMAAVHMGKKETGARTGHRCTYSRSLGWDESRYSLNICGAIKETSACNMMEIDGKEQGLEPSGPRPTDEVAWVACGFVIIM